MLELGLEERYDEARYGDDVGWRVSSGLTFGGSRLGSLRYVLPDGH